MLEVVLLKMSNTFAHWASSMFQRWRVAPGLQRQTHQVSFLFPTEDDHMSQFPFCPVVIISSTPFYFKSIPVSPTNVRVMLSIELQANGDR